MTRQVAVAAMIVATALPAWAEPQAITPLVTQVLTATSDVRDLAVAGEVVLVATSGGLLVRRGDRIVQRLGPLEGLPGARLRSLSLSDDGQSAWIASIEGVVQVALSDEVEVTVTRGLPLRRVRRVARFAGATWFASWGGGLHRLADGDDARPERVRFGHHSVHDQLTDLAVLDGELLVGTAGAGVFRLGADGRVRGRLRVRHGLADEVVWRIVVQGDRALVATADGLSVIEDRRVVDDAAPSSLAARLPVRDLRAVVVAPSGELWVGSHGGGVWRLPEEGGRPVAVGGGRGRRRLRRTAALAATDSAVLVGHDAGLHQVGADGAGLRALALGGLPSADVTALERAFGAVWIGTYNHGLARLARGRARSVDRAEQRWGVDRRVNDLAVSGRGTDDERLWIATDRGLYWHDGLRFVEVIDPTGPGRQHTTSLHVEAGSGDLWVASARQLSRRRGGRWESWTGDRSLPIVNLHAVTVDRAGRVWAGGLHGLYRLDPATGELERHAVSTGELPVDWVTALEPWGEGVVAGTYHGGLAWYDGRRFVVERERDGLPSGWVNPHALRRLGGALWLGSLEQGLIVGRRGQWSSVTIASGLPSDDVTDVLADGPGAAWVATRGGLARVAWSRP